MSKDEIVGDLEAVSIEWRQLSEKSQIELQNIQQYYKTKEEKAKDEVIQNAREIHYQEVKVLAESHRTLGSKSKTASDSLKSQVDSSENSLAKFKKHGFIAALGISVISFAVAIWFATDFSAFSLPVTILLAIIIVLGVSVVVFVGYLVIRIKRARLAAMWKRVEDDNKDGLRLYRIIEEKRTIMNELKDLLDSVDQANYGSSIDAVLEAIREYNIIS